MNDRIDNTDQELSDEQACDMSILIAPDGKNWTAVRGNWTETGDHPMGIGVTAEIALKNLIFIETQMLLEKKEGDNGATGNS